MSRWKEVLGFCTVLSVLLVMMFGAIAGTHVKFEKEAERAYQHGRLSAEHGIPYEQIPFTKTHEQVRWYQGYLEYLSEAKQIEPEGV